MIQKKLKILMQMTDSSANTDENKEPEKNTVYYVTDVGTAGSVYQAVQGAGHERCYS